jgi:Arc/MetJ-type ribon-helix-helix transcriptional regulator
VVRLTVDLPQELYDCLEEKARQRQRERGGRASKAEVIRKLIEATCKEVGASERE